MAAKSSSGAALLLLAAVLLAGTCTSPAHAVADPGPGMVENHCASEATIYAGSEATPIVVPAGVSLPFDFASLLHINLFDLIIIKILGRNYLIKIGLLPGLVGTTEAVEKIDILCNGGCEGDVISIVVHLLNLVDLLRIDLGPLCLLETIDRP